MSNEGKKPLISPLRYPGGKAFLCSYMERFLMMKCLRAKVFVEPFAGGASLSLHLLGKDLVDRIALFDLDPMVSGFWWTVFNDNAWLRKQVRETKITVDKWQEMRASSLNGHKSNGWRCLFLNRTTFSGILGPRCGPIGGARQASDYKIDCRFYRATLEARLKDLWQVRDRVDAVGTSRWEDTINRYLTTNDEDGGQQFFYLDPPFFHKAERLYNHVFSAQDHERLVRRLSALDCPWLLSYDYCNEAVALLDEYKLNSRVIPVRYTSAKQNGPIMKKELIASNLRLPEEEPPCR